MSHILDINDLYFAYDAAPVLRGISFHIDAGESVGLVGANGAGKTTLFRLILGLLEAGAPDAAVMSEAEEDTAGGSDARTLSKSDKGAIAGTRAALSQQRRHTRADAPEAGAPEDNRTGLSQSIPPIIVNGEPLTRRTLPDIRRVIGFVMQNSDDQMFMPTVYEDMVFGPLNYGCTREEAASRAARLLEELGIEGLRDRHNHKLSGGEKRMAAIATILAMEPSLLLMDEPTSALDPYNRRIVIRTISALPQARLIASHDLDMILETCGRVLLLDSGRVIADGPARDILSDRQLLEAHRLELPLSMQHA